MSNDEERKFAEDLVAFMNTLSEEIMDAAWGAGFLILLEMEGFGKFLIPSLKKGTDREEWLREFKAFVSGYRSESPSDRN